MNADNLEHRRFNQSFQSERPTPRQKSSRLSPLGAQATLLRCLRGADSLLRAISMQRLEQAPPPPVTVTVTVTLYEIGHPRRARSSA